MSPVPSQFPTRTRGTIIPVGHCAHGMVPGLYRDSVISASGVVTRGFGNVTTSYTVLYSSTPVVGRGRLAVLPGRVLSCPSGGSVSGSNGPREPRSRVTRGPLVLSRSILCLLYPFGGIFSSLTRLLCALSLASDFLSLPGKCICRLRARCRLLGVFLTVSRGIVIPVHLSLALLFPPFTEG